MKKNRGISKNSLFAIFSRLRRVVTRWIIASYNIAFSKLPLKTEVFKGSHRMLGIMCGCAVLALLCGCQSNAPEAKPSEPQNEKKQENFLPDAAEEKEFAKYSAKEQEEIKKLYGTYWMDGKKDNFISLRDSKMLVCSTSMSFGYTNIRWSKLGNAQWACTAYYSDDADYAQEGRKVILHFSAGEKTQLWQYIVLMSLKAGPFEKGKEPDALEGGGYKYDKKDSSAPKLFSPKWM